MVRVVTRRAAQTHSAGFRASGVMFFLHSAEETWALSLEKETGLLHDSALRTFREEVF